MSSKRDIYFNILKWLSGFIMDMDEVNSIWVIGPYMMFPYVSPCGIPLPRTAVQGSYTCPGCCWRRCRARGSGEGLWWGLWEWEAGKTAIRTGQCWLSSLTISSRHSRARQLKSKSSPTNVVYNIHESENTKTCSVLCLNFLEMFFFHQRSIEGEYFVSF